MKTFNKFFCSLLIVSCFLSCVREEIVPYHNEGKDKLVVIGLISPGEHINVYVGKPQPFGKDDYQLSDFNEPNAIVTIANSSGQQQKLTLSTTSSSVYTCSQSDFAIVPGKTYTISVKTSLNEVTAKTTVPAFAAVWKEAKLTGPEEHSYYTLSGSWDALDIFPEVNYGVSLNTGIKYAAADRTNKDITMINGIYHVKKEVLLTEPATIYAVLLTKDKAFGEFSKKSDLSLEVMENLSSTEFTEIISSFKGIIPSAGNINGGIGVFGSYLKDVRTFNR